MRALLCLCVCLAFSAAQFALGQTPTAKELLALEGVELQRSADALGFNHELTFSSADLIAIASKLAPMAKSDSSGEEANYAFSRFFRAACTKADARELDALVRLYVALDADSFDKQFSLAPLATAWIARELETRSDFPQVELPPLQTALPEKLVSAPAEVIAAWSLYQRASQAAAPLLRWDRQSEHVSFQRNESAFFRLIDDALLKRGDNIAERLAQFEWSGMSGTGSELLREPKIFGIFMALLEANRFDEAVSAAIELESHAPLTTKDGAFNVRIEFLRKCGVDWETIFIGAVADAEVLHERPFMEELAGHGSDRAAMILAEMAPQARGEKLKAYAETLSAFIPGDTEVLSVKRSEIKRYASPISDQTRVRILEVLQKLATPDASSDVATAALRGFARARAESTKPTLRALLKHRSQDVVTAAGEILSSLGEPIARPDQTPVRFQIFVNGRPLPANEGISWELQGTDTNMSSTRETDANGILHLGIWDREDPLLPGGSLIISTPRAETLETPYFRAALPIPEDLDLITRIDVQTWPVLVRIARTAPRADDGDVQATIKIRRSEGSPETPLQEPATAKSGTLTFRFFDSMERTMEAPLETPLQLSIQRGQYELEIAAPGAETFKTTFTVNTEATTLDVQLKPGRDLRFAIVRPDGERRARFILLHEGEQVDPEKFDVATWRYRGLPLGNYVLRIPSTAEVASDEGDEFARILTPYAGRDVPVTISDSSPDLIDLGEIHLDAER